MSGKQAETHACAEGQLLPGGEKKSSKVAKMLLIISLPLFSLFLFIQSLQERREGDTPKLTAHWPVGILGRDLNNSRGRERAVRWSLNQQSQPVNRWHKKREGEEEEEERKVQEDS